MNIKLTILEKITQWLVGGSLFEFVQETVNIVNNEDLTGSEKRDKVFREAKELFSDVATIFVNLAIEVAVLLLKEKIGKLDGNS